jgi:hypothetical protein
VTRAPLGRSEVIQKTPLPEDYKSIATLLETAGRDDMNLKLSLVFTFVDVKLPARLRNCPARIMRIDAPYAIVGKHDS